MSSQQDTTESTTPNQPSLCKMGCGFFGSNATGDCCSKCWGQLQASQQGSQKAVADINEKNVVPVPAQEPMEAPQPKVEEAVPAPVKKAKKKKKLSYKNMMNGMLNANGEKNVDKEREQLRQVVGGGNFAKIDKI